MPERNKRYASLRYIVPATVLVLASLILILVIPRNSPAVPETIDDNQFLLDTVVSIRLYESGETELLDRAFKLIEDYEMQLSRHRSGSEISIVNAAPAGVQVSASESTIELIKKGIEYAQVSKGTFDPTVGPLVDLWGIGGEGARIPDPEEISTTLALVDYQLLQLDENAGEVTLTVPGMALDLGGIAKGWIADKTADFLQENGEKHILINLGGNVLVSGGKPDGKPFKIGMQDPFDDRGRYLGIFTLENGSVVSSGIYERYFEAEGIRYHHILSTDDGYPVQNGIAAVTVLSEKSVDGDALSTTIFALGLDEGIKLVESLDGIDAAFITLDGKIIMTEGAARRFETSDPDTIIEIRRP